MSQPTTEEYERKGNKNEKERKSIVCVQKGKKMKLGESRRNRRTKKIKNEECNMFGDFRKVERVKILII